MCEIEKGHVVLAATAKAAGRILWLCYNPFIPCNPCSREKELSKKKAGVE